MQVSDTKTVTMCMPFAISKRLHSVSNRLPDADTAEQGVSARSSTGFDVVQSVSAVAILLNLHASIIDKWQCCRKRAKENLCK